MTRQLAIQYVKQDYESQGIDLNGVRNRFLWGQGLMMLGITALLGLAALGANYISSRAAARVGHRAAPGCVHPGAVLLRR